MTEIPSRFTAEPQHENSSVALRRSERMRVILVGALASALLALVMFTLASAVADDSGGVGTGGGGGGGGDRYDKAWDNFSHKNKVWARKTSECESGGNRKIHGGSGSYHGAFQYMLSTWRSAPMSPGGDPHKKRWKVQAVVSVKLKQRDGAKTHWPNCG